MVDDDSEVRLTAIALERRGQSDERDEPRLRVVSFDEVDRLAYARMQQAVFGQVLTRNGIPLERLGADVFSWKYAPPAGNARLALIESDGVMICGNAMFPVALVRGTERISGWLSCDGVTIPAARGKGHFRRCITALRENLRPGEISFGYPNQNSRGSFEEIGWTLRAKVPLRVRPVLWGSKAAPHVEPVDEFGAVQDALAEQWAQPGHVMILRSAAYLNWRYVRHPYFQYQCFYLMKRGFPEGLLVLNRTCVGGKRMLWVMECFAQDHESRSNMMSHAAHLARAQNCSAIASFDNMGVPSLASLPSIFFRKGHPLMSQRIEDHGEPTLEPWLVQTGDWDVL